MKVDIKRKRFQQLMYGSIVRLKLICEVFDSSSRKQQRHVYMKRKSKIEGMIRRRTTLNSSQLEILRTAFNKDNYATIEVVARLVGQTGLTTSQIRAWYEYQRRLMKRRQLEVQLMFNGMNQGFLSRKVAPSTTTFSASTTNYIHDVPELAQNVEQQIASSVDATEVSGTAPGYTLCAAASHEISFRNETTLPSISSMFPEIFNNRYDYTLPANSKSNIALDHKRRQCEIQSTQQRETREMKCISSTLLVKKMIYFNFLLKVAFFMGAAFVGVSTAVFLLGLCCAQAFTYFTQQNDPRVVRYMFQQTNRAQVYYYLVLHFNDEVFLDSIVWSKDSSTKFIFIDLLNQIKLAIQVAKYRLCITLLLEIIAVAQAGVAFVTIALRAVISIPIIEKWVQKTLHAVNTGAITSICAMSTLVSMLAAPKTLIYIAFYFCIGQLYTASLLATLNARNGMRNAADDTQTASGRMSPLMFKSFANERVINKSIFNNQSDIAVDAIDGTQLEMETDFMNRTPMYELYDTSSDTICQKLPRVPQQAHFNAI
ncbi:MAG: hypothetical protein NXY57DRAFT_1037381 [Lentinula lateritia]|nr:MAG: hypothetical protein NXY57DRAFT_1037381 [Lentinula lateritia]